MLFKTMTLPYTWAMGSFIGMQFVFFAEVSFRVRCGGPRLRILGKFRVNLYRRTPQDISYTVHPKVICTKTSGKRSFHTERGVPQSGE